MATKTKVAKSAPKAAATKAAPKKTVKVKAKSKSADHDKIARQAYMLWQQNGGSEIDNWLEAERQLR